MKCPICKSDNVQVFSKETIRPRFIKRSYECVECATTWETNEKLIIESIPEYTSNNFGFRIRHQIITKKDLKKAESLGISKDVLRTRIDRGMTYKEAVTAHLRGNKIDKELVKKAQSNGISYKNLYLRMFSYGWTEERATTTPLRKRTKK